MKLLIVDDEPPARERLRRLLAEIEDCEVVAEAGNGEEALSRCGELRPDVVLLDVRMPGLSGIQIARHIDTLEDPRPSATCSSRCARKSSRTRCGTLPAFRRAGW
jgi:two-component system response regulator AlgR